MEEKQERGGAVRVGMVWGGIGGVVGLVVSLLGSLVGIVVAVFIGVSCGRRAAAAEQRAGALSGLIGGAVAAPVYALGSTIGALFAAREIGAVRLAATLSELLGFEGLGRRDLDLLPRKPRSLRNNRGYAFGRGFHGRRGPGRRGASKSASRRISALLTRFGRTATPPREGPRLPLPVDSRFHGNDGRDGLVTTR